MSEKLDVNGETIDMPHNLREIINHSLEPIKDGINKIELSVATMTKDIQEIKLDNALQKKDIDIMKAQIHAQELTISALKDKLAQTENNIDSRITELERKDIQKKAKIFDEVTITVLRKIGNVVLMACAIGLCFIIGKNFSQLKQ